ncbi:hypothetical protein Rhe02_33580 [Rhizocola hellebori]|uniref:Uncharacterized protein n=1 Tax=Rhizocola hellebori TaxID=1392758 RepID=A0A8J3VGS0_9ACTN|nr:hypothetical protein Rhe02_33580 [Rhizocola hellebori]
MAYDHTASSIPDLPPMYTSDQGSLTETYAVIAMHWPGEDPAMSVGDPLSDTENAPIAAK